jgi:hypothetical protein
LAILAAKRPQNCWVNGFERYIRFHFVLAEAKGLELRSSDIFGLLA